MGHSEKFCRILKVIMKSPGRASLFIFRIQSIKYYYTRRQVVERWQSPALTRHAQIMDRSPTLSIRVSTFFVAPCAPVQRGEGGGRSEIDVLFYFRGRFTLWQKVNLILF